MKKAHLALILLFFSSAAFSQGGFNSDTIFYRGEPLNKPYPSLYLVIDTQTIKLDSAVVEDIDPKWIRRIVVKKEEKYKKLYGNVDGVILVYPKRRFKDEFIETIEKGKTVPNNR